MKLYECSSKGDKRFSAFYARLEDGRNIEEHYQCDIKGYDPGGTNWRLGKGNPPLQEVSNLFLAYAGLWWDYFQLNPELITEIKEICKTHKLTDCFAKTKVNQAEAISWLVENNYI